jgi:hypothetical protein
MKCLFESVTDRKINLSHSVTDPSHAPKANGCDRSVTDLRQIICHHLTYW